MYPYTFENYVKKPREVRCDGGESYGELHDRSLSEIKKIAVENDGKTVAVATHGGVIRALRTVWMGLEIEQTREVPHVTNASLTEVDYDAETDSFEIKVAGFADYLGDVVSATVEYEKK